MHILLMRRFLTGLLFFVLAGGCPALAAAAQKTPEASAGPEFLETILKGIEECYLGTGFTARFDQTSSLAAMGISDTAVGKLFVKHPNRMRWEYEKPEKQVILTDGKTLWIHRPADNQVLVGKAPPYLGGGQGGSFLSDIRTLREQFQVTLASYRPGLPAVLKLVPKRPSPELADLFISVDPDTFRVMRITTHNAYRDETQIVLSDYRFDLTLDDAFFRMEIPKNAEVFDLEKER